MAYSIYDYTTTYEFVRKECTISEEKSMQDGSVLKRYYYVVEGRSFGVDYEANTSQLEFTVKFYVKEKNATPQLLDSYDTFLDEKDRDYAAEVRIDILTLNNTFNGYISAGQAIYSTGPFTINNRDLLEKNASRTIAINVDATLILGTYIKGSGHISYQEMAGALIPIPSLGGISTSLGDLYIDEPQEIRIVHPDDGNRNILPNHGVPLYCEYRLSCRFEGSGIEDYVDLGTFKVNKANELNDISLTIPLSMCNYITNSTFTKATFKCETYAKVNESDSEFLAFMGISYNNATVHVPLDLKPQIVDFSIESYCSVPDLIVDENTYIADISKINVKINSIEPYGAKLASYKVGLVYGDWEEEYWEQLPQRPDNKILLSNLIETPEEEADLMNRGVLTEVIPRYYTFNNTIWATVTDSRGRTSDIVAIKLYVQDYYSPITGNLNAYRSNEDGTANENDSHIFCTCRAVIPETISIENITSYVTLYVKESSGLLNYVERKKLEVASSTIEGNIIFHETECFKDYRVEFLVSNGVEDFKILKTVPSISTILDVAPNGSIALGRIANDDNVIFEVSMEQVNYGNIIPANNDSYNLGDADHRWQTVFSVNALTTSDASFKENINYVILSNKARTSAEISQEDLHNFYKSDYQLATYNYVGQEQQEYGFITSDMYDNSVGESLIIRNENGDMFSMNSYISTIAGALQYEINLRDEQIATLNQIILEMKQELENLKQGD